MTTKKTPIALFTYNRPEHVARVLKSLAQCHRIDECQLHVYCDGPKSPGAAAGVNASRAVVGELAGALDATVVMREKNLGLARSIVEGVTDVCDRYGRAIVVEDDLVLSRDFIDFMLQGLDRYEGATDVYQVAGFMYPVDNPGRPDAFFLPFMSSWGWATWKRAWDIYDGKAGGWEQRLASRNERRLFDLDNSIDFYHMLKSTVDGQIDTWDILWYYQIYRRGGKVLYPRASLVWNGGFDGSGTNCGGIEAYQPGLDGFSGRKLPESLSYPASVTVDEEAFGRVKAYLRSLKPTRLQWLRERIRARLGV